MKKRLIGSHIIELEKAASTNAYTDKLLLSEKPEEGTVIIAYQQTQGKGQDQNKWESEANKNLTFSIILYPWFLDPSEQFKLIEVTALGITDFVKSLLPFNNSIKIKWPNDIYVGDHKLCGTLVQNSIVGPQLTECIIGIGLNVNQKKFLSDAPNPISLQQISGQTYDLKKCLALLCGFIDDRYLQLKNRQYSTLETDYLSSLYRYFEWYDFIIHEATIHARIIGITEYGQLRLESRDGKSYECGMKEVVYLR
jgi:BirA family transcriptional regulator, biotin operon repressor / biotin---[acetyl-CoA-carboxylase] ligase